jgi:hypothetical protein
MAIAHVPHARERDNNENLIRHPCTRPGRAARRATATRAGSR